MQGLGGGAWGGRRREHGWLECGAERGEGCVAECGRLRGVQARWWSVGEGTAAWSAERTCKHAICCARGSAVQR